MVQKLPLVTLLARMSISAPWSTIVIVIERKDYYIECATVVGILIWARNITKRIIRQFNSQSVSPATLPRQTVYTPSCIVFQCRPYIYIYARDPMLDYQIAIFSCLKKLTLFYLFFLSFILFWDVPKYCLIFKNKSH